MLIQFFACSLFIIIAQQNSSQTLSAQDLFSPFNGVGIDGATVLIFEGRDQDVT
jgi:hypothetical protein